MPKRKRNTTPRVAATEGNPRSVNPPHDARPSGQTAGGDVSTNAQTSARSTSKRKRTATKEKPRDLPQAEPQNIQTTSQQDGLTTCSTPSTAETSGSLGDNGVLDYEAPCMIDSVNTLLSSNVSQNIKDKIVNSKYVDISLLLDNTSMTEAAEKKIYFNEKGELVTKESSKAKININTIEKWTDAFLIYSSIYASAHQDEVQGLFKYMHDIRLGATRGMGWKKYDEQFRLRRSVNPSISWAGIDPELWLMYMHAPSQQAVSTQPSPGQITHNKCFNFNYRGFCSKQGCGYLHMCIKCNNGHPISSCPLKQTSIGQYQSFKGEGYPGYNQHSANFFSPGVPRFQPPFRAPGASSTTRPQQYRPQKNMGPRKNTY
ncbi:uncharacterized protein LOC134279286 [Saccostrea cucullata]|uniref:uncharacterized protein LOC134279286 n=1 Tax=Saccostrea cuccullata TaxID=36930 RepID=UPI002ED671A3